MLFLSLLAVTNFSRADITLKDKGEVTGTWKLDSTKNSANDRKPFPRTDTWVFKEGTLAILHIARENDFYDQPPQPYEIENGKVKVMTVGSSRTELYTVVDLTDKNMTLKGKYGTLYFFTKK